LKFEVVLAYCEKRVPEGSLLAAMDYGRQMQFINGYNSLSESGQLLAEMLILSTEDGTLRQNTPEPCRAVS